MSTLKKIVITTGDLDGIGLEVAAKALEKVGPQKGVQFFYFRGAKAPASLIKRIGRKFKIKTFLSWPEALDYEPRSYREIIEVTSAQPPPKWVESAAVSAFHHKIDALVTGPLSKPEIMRAGMKDLGHTDILKRISKAPHAWMTFLGKRFNVFLLSGHMPVQKIESSLTSEKLELGLREALRMFKPTARKPLGVLGLNPHAGDEGLIGSFDDSVLKPVLVKLRAEGAFLEGPLVPDAAFHEDHWKKFAAYVCCYHDQGLIPFKMIHGFETGVHVTAGLPFVRTSVDHGTAKDIFGKNKADPRSMIHAIKTAQQMVGREKGT
ncbi:MAG: 4-hydroxythreonine-4-phosphate dehydrogenase PdxA [Bdellovibrionaceae bacterium]|nr:4-hydroxythreonine-4-phosphate dehydrogenase PdxA [Pseudobdellovibrionaceae bacterium]